MPGRKREFRWVKWLIFLVLFVAAVTVVILVKNSLNDKTENNTEQTTNESKMEGKKSEKTESDPSDSSEEASKQTEKAPQYEGESPNESETLTGLISYADVVDNELVIRVNIDQFLQSGSCNLVMSRNGVTYYSKSVSIQESVTTSTCDGYKIPVSELSEGDFQVEINLESDGKSGKITGRVRL
ncbi:hypothetical protein IJG93_02165 [Candidatus Saccharibacteria bacterium]|nr:hypothetical protein [Candidatus Saccharibacteria bacterium]